MSKAVMLSIRPKWVEKIASGEKTIEVRKTRPKLDTPFKAYIYCTMPDAKDPHNILELHGADGKIRKANSKVIGEFTCDRIDEYDDDTIFSFRHEDYARWNDFGLDRACMHPEDFQNYADGKWLYGWHISGLKIYDKPRELREFKKINRDCFYADLGLAKRDCPDCKNSGCFLERPPQSWCYAEED